MGNSKREGKKQKIDTPKQIDYKGVEGLRGEALKIFRKLDVGNRRILCTKFFCPNTMEMLRLHEPMRAMMRRAGLEHLYSHQQPNTYKGLTLEFLSTLRKHLPESDEGEKFVTFRLLGEDRRCTYSELRDAIGVEDPDGRFTHLTTQECVNFWCAITGHTSRSHNSKNVDITNPVLRIIHRFNNMAFLGQGEPTKANLSSLSYLYVFTPMGQGIPDWVDIFIESCLAKQGSEKGGSIPFGGMITLIALSLEINVERFIPVAGYTLYDDDGLMALGMLCDVKFPKGIWCYGLENLNYMRLPRPRNNPLPFANLAESFYIPPDQEFLESRRHLSTVQNWLNEHGEGLQEQEEDEERNEEDVVMGETQGNWEAPIPPHQGEPWRHEPQIDTSTQQYLQF